MKLEKLIEEKYDCLNQNELYIWNYIFHHKKECQNISIQDLASRCNVSHATIQRFGKKIGFQGYSEFKYYLKWQEEESVFGLDEVNKSFLEFQKNLLMIKERDCSKLFELIQNANKIFLYGTGGVQKSAAKEFKRSFSIISNYVHVIEGYDEVLLAADIAASEDIFIIFSLSGENPNLIRLIQKVKEKGIKIISITQDVANTLAFQSDFHLSFETHRVKTRQSYYDVNLVAHYFVLIEFLFIKYLAYLG